MKTTSFLLLITAAQSLAPVLLSANDLSAENLTISASASFGSVYASGVGAQTAMPGFRVSVSQAASGDTVINSTFIQPEPIWEEVTVEDFGWVDEGYFQDQYQYGLISSEWVPAVIEDQGAYAAGAQVWVANWVTVIEGYYDADGNWIEAVLEDQGSFQEGPQVWVPNLVEVAAGYQDEQWGDVLTGQIWIPTGSRWDVVGTHPELQEVEQPSIIGCYFDEYTTLGPPRIKFTSTRSDANFVWQVPESDAPGSNVRDILIAGNGGLSIPSIDPAVQMNLFSDRLAQSRTASTAASGITYAAVTRAESTELTTDTVYSDGSTHNQVGALSAEHVRLTHTETVPGQPGSVTTQTQIAARSAHFAGVVTVEGSLKVQGVLRVMPAGGLSMGEFTNGPTPLN